ncbi:MAG: hypothetical protein KME54_17625 [Tolypothrix brevis GSE-NOS-MK-07-07A]|jgi:hypothetical protein|nr:hypothetical protein [Tolypothrix brevis GSE-NOS-MK-07-07A]
MVGRTLEIASIPQKYPLTPKVAKLNIPAHPPQQDGEEISFHTSHESFYVAQPSDFSQHPLALFLPFG